MKIDLYFIGKTTEAYLKTGIAEYLKRLQHYISVNEIILEPSRFSRTDFKKAAETESASILARLKATDYVILLDEKGKAMNSEGLASLLGKQMNTGVSKVVFITGGAYGVSDAMRKRANLILSFSNFTFTHQMIRLLLAEQVYRAMTILKNEKYHH